MNRSTFLLAGILTLTLLVAGCATTMPVLSAPQTGTTDKTEKAALPQDPQLAITTAEVQALLAGPDTDTYLIVDARPANKFSAGHVPGAVNIPKALLPQEVGNLPKDKIIIFYCGGLHCKLSPASAAIALKAGYTKVKVWYEGLPGWVKAGNYTEIETTAVAKLVTQASLQPYLLIDARPAVKYQQSFIPNAISLPKAEFEHKKGLLPADKNVPLIFYCGGYKCKLSHQSAVLALKLGYQQVAVYAAGQPAWEKAKLPLWGNESSGVIAQKKTEQRPAGGDHR